MPQNQAKGVTDSHTVVERRMGDTSNDVAKFSRSISKRLNALLNEKLKRGEVLLFEEAVRSVLRGEGLQYRFVCDLQFVGHWGIDPDTLGMMAISRNMTPDEGQRLARFCVSNNILIEKSHELYTQEGVRSKIYEFSRYLRSTIRHALLKGVIPNLHTVQYRESDARSEIDSLESNRLLFKYEYVPPSERGAIPTTYFVPNSLGFYKITLDMAEHIPIVNRLSNSQSFVVSLHQRQALQTVLGLPIFYEPSPFAIPTKILTDIVQVMDKCTSLRLARKDQVDVPMIGGSLPSSVPSYEGVFTANLLGLTPSTLLGHEDYLDSIVDKQPTESSKRFTFGQWVHSFPRYYNEYWLRYVMDRQFDWLDSNTKESLIGHWEQVILVCSGRKSAAALARETDIPLSILSQIKRKAVSSGLAGRIHFRSHKQYFFG